MTSAPPIASDGTGRGKAPGGSSSPSRSVTRSSICWSRSGFSPMALAIEPTSAPRSRASSPSPAGRDLIWSPAAPWSPRCRCGRRLCRHVWRLFSHGRLARSLLWSTREHLRGLPLAACRLRRPKILSRVPPDRLRAVVSVEEIDRSTGGPHHDDRPTHRRLCAERGDDRSRRRVRADRPRDPRQREHVEARFYLQKFGATDRAREAFEQRAAVPAAVTYDSTWAGPLVPFQGAADAFAETLRNLSAFDTVLGDGAFLRVPPQTTVAITTAGAAATVVGEAAPKPASVLTFVSANVTMSKVPVFVVVSAELMKAGGPGPLAMLGRELRGALAQGTDAYFLAQLLTGLTAIPSTGQNSRRDPERSARSARRREHRREQQTLFRHAAADREAAFGRRRRQRDPDVSGHDPDRRHARRHSGARQRRGDGGNARRCLMPAKSPFAPG